MQSDSKSAMRVYVWDRRFLLQAPTFALGGHGKPYKRLSATIIIASRKPFVLGVNGEPPEEHQGVLIAPNVLRDSIKAIDSDLTILDAGITSAAFYALRPKLVPGKVHPLPDDTVQHLQGSLRPSHDRDLTCQDAARLYDKIIHGVSSRRAPAVGRDPRVQQAMDVVERMPFDELSPSLLARKIGLSEARLRSLFQKSLGCPPSQYIRWASAWKAINLLTKEKTLTEVMHAAGFYDLAHGDHVIGELFGMSPSLIFKSRWVNLHKCGP